MQKGSRRAVLYKNLVHMNRYSALFFFLWALIFSCTPPADKITTSSAAKLSFSQDSILFDTIFSSLGSTTQLITIYNPNKNAVRTDIKLGGGSASSYSLIINGTPSYNLDLEIDGKDSILILITVLINPKDTNLPYLVHDSIVFSTNGNVQSVQLEAYGQDANFIKGPIPCNQLWNDPKPYVLYNTVTVAAGCTLTIPKGTKVYAHNNAMLKVYGTLLVNGVKSSPVIFRGDRLEESYASVPGQWTGILFEAGSTANLNWAVIENAVDGIEIRSGAPKTDTIPDFVIANSVIKNMSDEALKAIGANVYAYNSLFTNCANYVISADGGGNYYFYYCTIAGYSPSLFRMNPSLQISATTVTSDSSTQTGQINARLINTIVWGDGTYSNELALTPGSDFSLFADYSLIYDSSAANLNGIGNKTYGAADTLDPKFNAPYNFDFHLESGSSALGAGIPLSVNGVAITTDLDSVVRSTTKPSIGAYEK